MSVEAEEVFFANLLEMVARPFRHEAENRRLAFEVQSDPQLTRSLVTDSKRLQQVLKNLLSNAFKFTEHGAVRLAVSVATKGWSEDHPILSGAASVVAFEVTDSGIGIALDKQRIIFEAFQQADASTSRKYGGTGLGLAISRELASLLGGEIQLAVRPVRAARLRCTCPRYIGPSASKRQIQSGEARSPAMPVEFSKIVVAELPAEADCRRPRNLQPDDAVLLIVEDDPHYARILCDLSRDKGFKVLFATGAPKLSLWRTNSIPPPFLWMSFCPTCWAGRSSTI